MTRKIKKYEHKDATLTEMPDQPKSTGIRALEKVMEDQGQFDPEFVKMMCGGIGTTVMELEIFDQDSGETIFKFPMRVLSMSEEIKVEKDTREAFSKLPDHQKSEHIYICMLAKAVVRKSLTPDSVTDKPLCGEGTIEMMTKSQILSLHERYEILSEIVSPNIDKMEQEALADLVGKLRDDFSIATMLSRQLLLKILKYYWDWEKYLESVTDK